MIRYECVACETIAYTSATGGSSYGCPSCGAPLEEVGAANERRPAAEVAPLLPVRAVRSAEGLRERAT